MTTFLRTRYICLLVLLASYGHSRAEQPTTKVAAPDITDVFVSGKDGYFAYRIPSLVAAPNGDLLVFCEARKNNLADDGNIDLLMKRSTDNGATWSPQQLVYEEGGDAQIKYGNPTAVIDRSNGVIWLATNRDYLNAKGARGGGALVLFHSDDNGKTWSPPRDITSSIKGKDWGHHAFGPGVGIQIQHGSNKGRLVLPANYRKSFDKRKPSYSHVIYSDDHGKSWKLGGELGDYTNECQVAEITEGGKPGLLINMRNHWGRGGVAEKSGYRLAARSFDGGMTWSDEQMDRSLPEPPCQAALFRHRFAQDSEPGWLLFANPAGPGRAKLRLQLSLDEGRSWPHSKVIYPGAAAYSCMAKLSDTRIGIVYERDNYQRISFSAIDVAALTQ